MLAVVVVALKMEVLTLAVLAELVVAAAALSKQTEQQKLTVGSDQVGGAFYRTVRADMLEGRPLTIANTGTTDARLVVTTSGNPGSTAASSTGL